VNTDVEDTCVDVSKEGHDDVNTYVRIHNIRLQYGSLLSQLEEFSGASGGWAEGRAFLAGRIELPRSW